METYRRDLDELVLVRIQNGGLQVVDDKGVAAVKSVGPDVRGLAALAGCAPETISRVVRRETGGCAPPPCSIACAWNMPPASCA